MEKNWKRENDIFYYLKQDTWCCASASDVFCSAFNSAKMSTSAVPDGIESIKVDFPEIRFSKFEVPLKAKLVIKDGKIVVEVLFCKNGNEYAIEFPHKGGIDYGFVENVWCYFTGAYCQLIDLFSSAGIDSSIISFRQYINLLNQSGEYSGCNIEDQAGSSLITAGNTDSIAQPEKLQATLYPYQETGYHWLKYITDEDCGCILGDEMGLGKTIQVIALFLKRTEKKTPFLVVAPLSLLENWRREINKFAPSLSVLVHHGNDRTGRYKDLLSADVIVTSYGTAVSDLSMLEMVTWDLLILDEAQNIKSPDTTRTRTIKQIPRRASIAVTGTPFENHITDIWSILDFTVPGCMGSLGEFCARYPDDISGAERIEPVLTALMIRRRVTEVAKDLPEKVIIPQPLVMEEAEAVRYEDTRQALLSSFSAASATIATLTKLRMYCTHPFLVTGEGWLRDPLKVSTKYARFCEILEEIVSMREKVIVFTSYIEMFEIFCRDIPARFGIPVDCINGSTPAARRQEIVDDFSAKTGSAMLVLNPKAAGVGLNITAANHVIHYNLEWNPALEDQATARSYRRGQDKTVFVYRLFYTNTVEEIVDEKIENKRDMSETAVVGSLGTEDTKKLIMNALGMSPLKGGN